MIISNIIGGLGNQMFQYAAGRALSLKQDVPLLLDVSGFSSYGLHQGFELDRLFYSDVKFASKLDVHSLLGWQNLPSVRRILSRSSMKAFRSKKFVFEPHFEYWQAINQVPHDSYLLGYWQSEKYFNSVAQQIREDFVFRPQMNSKNAQLALTISQHNAVSLHIRRGDYINDPVVTATHGLCSIAYYQNAINYISAQVAQPYFFIFSDDMDWVKENLKMDLPCIYIDHNQGVESYNDMRLMSLCRHHIIANSSFSWWGAWLNPSADKIVAAPKHWFAKEVDTQDLIPQSWVRL
jgi:hypothetical protein